MPDNQEQEQLDNEQPEVDPSRRKPGRPRKEDRVSDPETMMTEAVQENLRVLSSTRIKIEKLVKRVSETLDKHSEEGDNGLEKQQAAAKTLSEIYKTLSDSTANAVKALGALKKFQPSVDENQDQEILDRIFSEDKNDKNS